MYVPQIPNTPQWGPAWSHFGSTKDFKAMLFSGRAIQDHFHLKQTLNLGVSTPFILHSRWILTAYVQGSP